MASKPILLFLHGVGEGDPDGTWMESLSNQLVDLGYPDLREVKVIAPKYPNTLRWPSDDKETLPNVTIKTLSGAAGQATPSRLRASYRRLGGNARSTRPRNGVVGGEPIVDIMSKRRRFVQAHRYSNDAETRARVLNRIIQQLPETGRLVIIGHSLGSVIAADLIRRLPAGLEVAGMVTLGSPLAHRRFHVEDLKSNLEVAPSNLAWWVNFWNDADPVTTHRGVSSVFPWMLDHRVRTRTWLDSHDAKQYLRQSAVATAVGFALFGSKSKALVLVEKVSRSDSIMQRQSHCWRSGTHTV